MSNQTRKHIRNNGFKYQGYERCSGTPLGGNRHPTFLVIQLHLTRAVLTSHTFGTIAWRAIQAFTEPDNTRAIRSRCSPHKTELNLLLAQNLLLNTQSCPSRSSRYVYESVQPGRLMHPPPEPDRSTRYPMSRHKFLEVQDRLAPAGRSRRRLSQGMPWVRVLSRSPMNEWRATAAAQTPLSRGSFRLTPSARAYLPDEPLRHGGPSTNNPGESRSRSSHRLSSAHV